MTELPPIARPAVPAEASLVETLAVLLIGTLRAGRRRRARAGQQDRRAGVVRAAPCTSHRGASHEYLHASARRTAERRPDQGGHTNAEPGSRADVRTEPPARRHELIFETYGGLAPDDAFVLVNDHDPKLLCYQFAAEHPDRFNWDYLEQGIGLAGADRPYGLTARTSAIDQAGEPSPEAGQISGTSRRSIRRPRTYRSAGARRQDAQSRSVPEGRTPRGWVAGPAAIRCATIRELEVP